MLLVPQDKKKQREEMDMNSVSEISVEAESPFEVTREDYAEQIGEASPQNSSQRGVAGRISNLIRRSSQSSSNRRSRVLRDNQSVNSDQGTTQSLEGVQSLTSYISHETVKASNTTIVKHPTPSGKKKGGWTKLKRMIGVKTTSSSDDHSTATDNEDSKSVGTPSRDKPSITKRVRSFPHNRTRAHSEEILKEQHRQEMSDDSLVGRLDGIDLMALGGVQSRRDELLTIDEHASTEPTMSFIGDSFILKPPQIIHKMLHRQPTEIFLDGFIPGVSDRWSVRIEDPALLASSSDGGSPHVSTLKLWNSLWGSDPPPDIVNRNDLDDTSNNDEPILQLAAECSVPIDVDEDTFMISTREHLCAVHEIASLPLQKGNFELALGIFYKLLKGLSLHPDHDFLTGTVLHNIGILQCWQGDYQKALSSFTKATEERIKHLPKNHPDIIVSMIRKGMMYFALEQFDDAVAVLEVALPLVGKDHITKAKIQNNLGVIYYYQGDSLSALKEFTKSLEIQRLWLDAASRREPLVVDAAITMGNMARVYMDRSDYQLACHVYEEALLLQTTIFAKDTDVVLASVTNLALATAKSGNVKRAIQILHGCLRSKNARFGVNSAKSIETIGLLGHLYTKRRDYPGAMKCFSTVRKWQMSKLPSGHPAHQQTKALIAVIEDEIGDDSSVWV